MKTVYFDNSATTELSAAAKEKMAEAMECYGNPSSLHPLGTAARALVEQARANIAKSLGLRSAPKPGELVFTGCGSEADNLAILGAAYAKPRRKGGRIITTDSEHPGVDNAMKRLEADGFDVVRIPTKNGVLDFDAFSNALNDKTFLVSLMMVNNETGALYDVKRAFSLAKAKNPAILTHTDAVQGYLKCRFSPESIKADFVTVSAHKIHGPKGVGALYISPEAIKRKDIVPVIYGGGQEAGFRSGTENTVGIAGFGAAAKEGYETLNASLTHLAELRTYCEEKLENLPVRILRPAGERAPHILNLILPDIRSETMLHALSAYGICVSNGSACSSHSHSQSHALLAFGVSPEETECSIRVSFNPHNTEEEVDFFADALAKEIDRLVKIHHSTL